MLCPLGHPQLISTRCQDKHENPYTNCADKPRNTFALVFPWRWWLHLTENWSLRIFQYYFSTFPFAIQATETSRNIVNQWEVKDVKPGVLMLPSSTVDETQRPFMELWLSEKTLSLWAFDVLICLWIYMIVCFFILIFFWLLNCFLYKEINFYWTPSSTHINIYCRKITIHNE